MPGARLPGALLALFAACTPLKRGEELRDVGVPTGADVGSADALPADAAPPDAGLLDAAGRDAGGCALPAVTCGAACRDCLEGGCAAGACRAGTFARVGGVPLHLTVDGDWLYWSTGNTVKRARRSGGGTSFDVVTTTLELFDLLARDGVLYWMEYDEATHATEAYRLEPDNARRVRLVRGSADPAAMAFDGQRLWFMTFGDGIYATSATVTAIPRLVVDRRRLADAHLYDGSEHWLDVDDRNLYWTNGGGNTDWDSVVATPKTGTSSITILVRSPDVTQPGWLRQDATHLYVGNGYKEGEIMRVPKVRGRPEVVAVSSREAWPMWIAVDRGAVYWVERQDDFTGRVRGKDLRTGANWTFDDRPGVWGVAADERAVYWSTWEDIERIVR